MMRQRFFSFALAAVTALMISSSAWAQERVNARVNAPGLLGVRTGPATAYRLLGSIPNGTAVEVRSQLGAWSQIAYGTGTAWVLTAYLAPLTTPSTGAPSSGAAPSTGAPTIQLSSGGIQANFGGLQVRIGLSGPAPLPRAAGTSPTAGTAPRPGSTPNASILLSSLLNGLNGLRTQPPRTTFPKPIDLPSPLTTPISKPTGTTTGNSTGTTSLGAGPETTPRTTPQATTPRTTPQATTPRTTPPATSPQATTPRTTPQTGTAPSAPASTTPLPTSSAYNPSTTTPFATGGYIQLRASGAGHYGYGTAARKFGRPALIYGLERISAGFASTGHKMGVGDISQNGGGAISGHDSHRLGIDVDVRPCRKDRAQQPVTWQQTAVYDRAATQTLGNLFGRELRLTNFFYNDPQVSVRTKTRYVNHDNHFHARVNPIL